MSNLCVTVFINLCPFFLVKKIYIVLIVHFRSGSLNNCNNALVNFEINIKIMNALEVFSSY